MKVTRQQYYHFQRINDVNIKWKAGDKIVFDSKRKNYYFSSLEESVKEILKENKISSKKLEKIVHDIIHGTSVDVTQKQLDDILNLIKNNLDKNKLIQYFQELIYEHIRQIKYNHLPSRQNCIWIVPYRNDLTEWEKILNCIRSRILKLNLTGEIFRTSGILISTDKNRQIINTFKNAEKYWSADIDGLDEKEYLFEGTVEIGEEIIDKIE